MKQVQLEAAGDKSVSADERRKAHFLIPDCLGEDAWNMIENKARHMNDTDVAGQLASMETSSTAGQAKYQARFMPVVCFYKPALFVATIRAFRISNRMDV